MIVRPIKLVWIANEQSKVCEPQLSFSLVYTLITHLYILYIFIYDVHSLPIHIYLHGIHSYILYIYRYMGQESQKLAKNI